MSKNNNKTIVQNFPWTKLTAAQKQIYLLCGGHDLARYVSDDVEIVIGLRNWDKERAAHNGETITLNDLTPFGARLASDETRLEIHSTPYVVVVDDIDITVMGMLEAITAFKDGDLWWFTDNYRPVTAHWTIASGRTLCRDGVPVFELSRYALDTRGKYATTPTEADDLAAMIADALNAFDARK